MMIFTGLFITNCEIYGIIMYIILTLLFSPRILMRTTHKNGLGDVRPICGFVLYLGLFTDGTISGYWLIFGVLVLVFIFALQ